jgi:GNAT superfamily N-acetyltransferase
MPNKVIVKEIRRIKSNTEPFINIVYDNFKYLSDIDQLNHTKEEITRLLFSSDLVTFLVYNDDKKVIAYLLGEKKVLNDGRIVFYINYLYVGERMRYRKIGSQLMNLIEKKCHMWNIKNIILTCDTHDEKIYNFYKKLEFFPDQLLRNHGQYEVLTKYL